MRQKQGGPTATGRVEREAPSPSRESVDRKSLRGEETGDQDTDGGGQTQDREVEGEVQTETEGVQGPGRGTQSSSERHPTPHDESASRRGTTWTGNLL